MSQLWAHFKLGASMSKKKMTPRQKAAAQEEIVKKSETKDKKSLMEKSFGKYTDKFKSKKK
jgi:hypothetical protein